MSLSEVWDFPYRRLCRTPHARNFLFPAAFLRPAREESLSLIKIPDVNEILQMNETRPSHPGRSVHACSRISLLFSMHQGLPIVHHVVVRPLCLRARESSCSAECAKHAAGGAPFLRVDRWGTSSLYL